MSHVTVQVRRSLREMIPALSAKKLRVNICHGSKVTAVSVSLERGPGLNYPSPIPHFRALHPQIADPRISLLPIRLED